MVQVLTNNEREKYHPKASLPLATEIRVRKLQLFNLFEVNLKMGKYDDVSFTEKKRPSRINSKIDDKEEEYGDQNDKFEQNFLQPNADISTDNTIISELHDHLSLHSKNEEKEKENLDREPVVDPFIIFVRSIKEDLPRAKLLQYFSVPGLKHLVLSDPRVDRYMTRMGWLVFDQDTDMEATLKELSNKKYEGEDFSFAMNSVGKKRTKFTTNEALEPTRISKDLIQIRTLAFYLDSESSFKNFGKDLISERVSKLSHEGDNESKELDIYIEYLNAVHCYDYYSNIESQAPEDHVRFIFLISEGLVKRLEVVNPCLMVKKAHGRPIWTTM
jgi:hypothetical protein